MQGPGASVPRPRSPVELQRVVAMDRLGAPYLLYRDGTDVQVEFSLAGRMRLAVGRDPASDVALPWDGSVSRLHAELERRAETWLVIDDGVSTNGTLVNGERVRGRRRLLHGDVIRVGRTALVFHAPVAAQVEGTAPVHDEPEIHVTPAQRRVLEALCRPFVVDPATTFPPTNAEIAQALVVSERAVKSQMRALFRSFGIEHLPQNAKRSQLVELALAHGIAGAGSRGSR